MRRLLYASSTASRTPSFVANEGAHSDASQLHVAQGVVDSSSPPQAPMTLVATKRLINIHVFILIFITCREISLRRLCLTLARAQRCQGVVTEIAEFHQLPMMIVFSVRPRVADREHGFCASG